MKTRLLYPVIVTEYNDAGTYFVVTSPNIEGMVTEGDSFSEAVYWAEDAIATMIEGMETYPKVQDPSTWELSDKQHIVYISVNMSDWMARNSKTIKKTVTVPEYLAKAAKEQGLNSSQIFTEALHDRLGV